MGGLGLGPLIAGVLSRFDSRRVVLAGLALFLGSLSTANRLAPAGRRGQVVSAFFVASYAGLIIPVIGVGVLSGLTGTFPAVLTFSVLLAALSLFSVSRFTLAGRGPALPGRAVRRPGPDRGARPGTTGGPQRISASLPSEKSMT